MSVAVEEASVTAVHPPGTAVERYAAPPVPEEYRAKFVMTPEEAGALDQQLRDCMRAVLVPDVDYGTIPGMGTKPSLFKPGAEKLIQWFGFGFDNVRDEIERTSDGARIGVTYRCTVHKELADGRKVTVATCEGYAGYDEDKFYVSAADARAKAEAKERMWASKDRRQPNAAKWESASEYRAPWNSVLKMAQKRALVGAAIDATSAAGLFTQDLEDMRDSAASDGFAEAAREALMALPDRVRDELDAWYRAEKWPDPGRWTAQQWCAALIEAGAVTGRQPGSRPAAQAQAQAAPPGETDAHEADLSGWETRIRAAGKLEALAALSGDAERLYKAGKLGAAAAHRVKAMLDLRVAEIGAQAPAGAGEGQAPATPEPPATAPDSGPDFARLFRERTAKAGMDAIRPMKVELARAVASKVITPDVGNELGQGLKARADEIQGAAA